MTRLTKLLDAYESQAEALTFQFNMQSRWVAAGLGQVKPMSGESPIKKFKRRVGPRGPAYVRLLRLEVKAAVNRHRNRKRAANAPYGP